MTGETAFPHYHRFLLYHTSRKMQTNLRGVFNLFSRPPAAGIASSYAVFTPRGVFRSDLRVPAYSYRCRAAYGIYLFRPVRFSVYIMIAQTVRLRRVYFISPHIYFTTYPPRTKGVRTARHTQRGQADRSRASDGDTDNARRFDRGVNAARAYRDGAARTFPFFETRASRLCDRSARFSRPPPRTRSLDIRARFSYNRKKQKAARPRGVRPPKAGEAR